MSETRSLPLRILYTINGSPQYILARSFIAFPVQSVTAPTPVNPLDTQKLYGTVPLRACLETICRSSPELVQDKSRDYSMYVLDPLESVSALASIPMMDNQGASGALTSAPVVQQRGVAVGLGFLSLALASEESKVIPIAGTLINPGSYREALEVIFSLRETSSTVSQHHGAPSSSVANYQSDSASSISSGGSQSQSRHNKPALSPLSLAKARAKGLLDTQPVSVKPKAPERPMSEADILMASGITYTGPPKKKGRPSKSSHKVRTPIHPPTSSAATSNPLDPLPQPATDNRAVVSSKRLGDLPPPFATTPLVRRPPSEPSAPPAPSTLLDVLTSLASSPAPHLQEAQNAALLRALSAIDSTMPSPSNPGISRSASNPSLVSALKQLISASVTKPNSIASPPGVPTTSSTCSSRTSPLPSSEPPSQTSSPAKTLDDEIVVLDKENINPTAFRRRAERERAEAKLLFLSASSSSSCPSEAPNDNTSRSGLSSTRNLSNRTPVTAAPASLPTLDPSSSSSSGAVKKRRLSNPLDEAVPPKRLVMPGETRRFLRKTDSTPVTDRTRRYLPSSFSEPVAGSSTADARRLLKRADSTLDTDPMRHYARISYSQPTSGSSTSPQGNERHYDRVFRPPSSPPKRSSSMLDPNTRSSPPRASTSCVYRLLDRTVASSASSPPRPSPSLAPPRPKKKYVVPEWARTDTATQPRLSEEAQKALAEAAAAKERERIERQTRRRGVKGVRGAQKRASVLQQESETSEYSGSESSQTTTLASASRAATTPQFHSSTPVTANTSCPVFSILNTRSSPSPDRPRTPPYSSSVDMPVTPPRRSSESDALFTPTPKARGPATPLFSPFGAAGSPAPKSRIWSQIGLQAVEPEEEEVPEDEDTEMADFLSEELHETADEVSVESPPDSLPIASSDTECEDATPTYEDADIKQHWDGLPPSSPPPPSSPFDLPQALPPEFPSERVTPEPEMDAAPTEDTNEDVSTPSKLVATDEDPTTIPTMSANDLAMYFELNDFATYFATPDSSILQPNETLSDDTAALFDQFTNMSSDEFPASNTFPDMTVDPNPVSTLNPADTLPNMDVTEFWQTMLPLLEASSRAGGSEISDLGIPSESNQLGSLSMENVDHEKLAEEVQALFSGCLT